jgi:hypothetical protein
MVREALSYNLVLHLSNPLWVCLGVPPPKIIKRACFERWVGGKLTDMRLPPFTASQSFPHITN